MFYKAFATAALCWIAVCGVATASQPTQWTYYTVDNVNDPANNELTGINNRGKVSGFAGSPAHAYVAEAPYARFVNISFPGAVSSEALAIDNTFDQGGAYLQAPGQNQQASGQTNPLALGYLRQRGKYRSLPDPIFGINHILCGIAGGRHCPGNNSQSNLLAVGTKDNAGYVLDTVDGTYSALSVPGSTTTEATGINGKGDICGNDAGGIWLLRYQTTKYETFAFPGAVLTRAYGLNWQEQIVGSYIDIASKTHGFILSNPHSAKPIWQSIDEPNASGATVITSINDHVDFVGFYVDAAGGKHGFLAVPQR